MTRDIYRPPANVETTISQPLSRPVLGFLVAPLAPCILIAAFVSRDVKSFFANTLYYAVFAYPFSFVFGIPAYWLMSRRSTLSMVNVTVGGCILGINSGVIIFSLPLGLFFGVFGAITGWVFWRLALRGRSPTVFEVALRDETAQRP
jgi:hypothetical protein